MEYRVIFQQAQQFQAMRQQSEEFRFRQLQLANQRAQEGIIAECYRLRAEHNQRQFSHHDDENWED